MEARLACGLAQAQFAEQLGLDEQDVAEFERGAVRTPPEVLYNAAQFFGRPLSWLFGPLPTS
ncbi:MAG: helix-turn-helix transcriptional regulator [Acidisphaera sp.]|nr:helix-turn-helix transcriptional regulator [Acidisphaera sp.]